MGYAKQRKKLQSLQIPSKLLSPKVFRPLGSPFHLSAHHTGRRLALVAWTSASLTFLVCVVAFAAAYFLPWSAVEEHGTVTKGQALSVLIAVAGLFSTYLIVALLAQRLVPSGTLLGAACPGRAYAALGSFLLGGATTLALLVLGYPGRWEELYLRAGGIAQVDAGNLFAPAGAFSVGAGGTASLAFNFTAAFARVLSGYGRCVDSSGVVDVQEGGNGERYCAAPLIDEDLAWRSANLTFWAVADAKVPSLPYLLRGEEEEEPEMGGPAERASPARRRRERERFVGVRLLNPNREQWAGYTGAVRATERDFLRPAKEVILLRLEESWEAALARRRGWFHWCALLAAGINGLALVLATGLQILRRYQDLHSWGQGRKGALHSALPVWARRRRGLVYPSSWDSTF